MQLDFVMISKKVRKKNKKEKYKLQEEGGRKKYALWEWMNEWIQRHFSYKYATGFCSDIKEKRKKYKLRKKKIDKTNTNCEKEKKIIVKEKEWMNEWMNDWIQVSKVEER